MQDRNRLNHVLRTHGLPGLDDAGVLQAMAFLVQDHEHFRQLLAICEPEQRVGMYDSMRPYLRFQAHPLDVYMSETGRLAAQKQLPVLNADGSLSPFHPAEISAAPVDQKLEALLPDVTLTVTCRKCTKTAEFQASTRVGAIYEARMAGWTWDELRGDGKEICPDCPATRKVD